MDKLRKRAIDGIANATDADPRQLTSLYSNGWLFRGHPYGRSTSGGPLTEMKLTDPRFAPPAP